MLILETHGLVIEIPGSHKAKVWEITDKGRDILIERHPKLKIKLISFIKSAPQILIIISGIIGFAGSAAGLIQFFDWLPGALHLKK